MTHKWFKYLKQVLAPTYAVGLISIAVMFVTDDYNTS